MKKAIITIKLVPEADDTPDEDIKKEILSESKIPWMSETLSVKIESDEKSFLKTAKST